MAWASMCSCSLYASPGDRGTPSIQVVGLFKDVAIIRQNNQQTVLRVGTSRNGLRLIEASSERAVFEYQGHKISHSLSDSPVLNFSGGGTSGEVRIVANNGSYQLSGSINGVGQEFILDTGATYVTLTAHQAQALGINYLHQGKHLQLRTANGVADAYLVTVDSVRVGDIQINQVQAAVLPNFNSDKILLGASFLNNVSLVSEGQVMLLQKK
ncbi:MAG: retroviral-like aspartic protease family protein [Gammaproteobacteria bacterium]|nr:retroviral-like aspartic protease family protein [Gammaproteobacteria bacterium]